MRLEKITEWKSQGKLKSFFILINSGFANFLNINKLKICQTFYMNKLRICQTFISTKLKIFFFLISISLIFSKHFHIHLNWNLQMLTNFRICQRFILLYDYLFFKYQIWQIVLYQWLRICQTWRFSKLFISKSLRFAYHNIN